MKKIITTFFLLITSLAGTVVWAEQQPWASKMQNLAGIIKEIIPILASDKKFSDPKNKETLIQTAEALSKMSHGLKAIPDINQKINLPDADPSIQIIAELFESETALAVNALKSGESDFARAKLKSVTTYCIACHTRNESGPKFKNMNPDSLASGLTPLEKAQLFAALREFDKAQDILNPLLSNTNFAKKFPSQWERAVRLSLALAVRVKNNPEQALAVVETTQGNNSATTEIKNTLPEWKKSLIDWKNDNSQSPNALTEASALIKKATGNKIAQRGADIFWLRATALLHDALKAEPNSPQTARILYLTGLAYQALDDFGLWSLHELYFQACINKAPHSSTSGQCWAQLNKSVNFSYSGSAGTTIPEDIQAQLNELKKLAY